MLILLFDPRGRKEVEDVLMILRANRCTLTLFLLILVTASTGQRTSSAIEQFQGLQGELRKSHAAKDWHAYLVSATKLKEFLNGSPDSLLEVARADVHVDDVSAALRELDEFLRMGQSADLIAKSADFSALAKNENFVKLRTGMEANRRPISLGSTAFQLSDSGLLAEDIDYDPRSKRFFVSSVREKKIVLIETSGANKDFARAPDDWPILAVKVDPSRGVLWATEVAMQGFTFAPESDWGKSAVLCYDLKNGKLLRRVEGPRPSALGDMVLTGSGDVIVSDGDGGGVYRLLANGTKLERLDEGDFISPQTPALHPDGKHIFVPDYVRGIGVLETTTKHVRWVSMDGKFALNGIDGLYFDRGKLIAIQNGTSPERVVVFTLDATLTKIESETIMERSTETLGDPTHGVVIENDFYYIANSGWDAVDDRGNMKPGARLSVARIMRARIQSLETGQVGN
jgi:sugar lactone lactonase YvrE